jgi:hypothetical protein
VATGVPDPERHIQMSGNALRYVSGTVGDTPCLYTSGMGPHQGERYVSPVTTTRPITIIWALGSLPVKCCWLAVAALDHTYTALLTPDSHIRRAKRDLTIPPEQQHPRGGLSGLTIYLKRSVRETGRAVRGGHIKHLLNGNGWSRGVWRGSLFLLCAIWKRWE